jgi:uncharacterized protein (DUF427 family)
MQGSIRAHAIRLEPTVGRVRVWFASEIVAETTRAITLYEGRLEPVQYLPLEDVRNAHLVRSEHRSHCPFKGDAGYYDLVVGARTARNAVWFYAQPLDAAAEIAGRVAFYRDRVDAIDIETPVSG